MEGDNLELAGDLSQYPLAQQAIKKMHPDLMNLDLSQGHTIYSNGEITNGITLNLKDKNLKGTIIKALGGGGFSIWKGSSDQGFSFEDNFFDLSEAQGPIEIRNANEFILSNGARMRDFHLTEVESLFEGTKVTLGEEGITVEGIATARAIYLASVKTWDPDPLKKETPEYVYLGVGFEGLNEADSKGKFNLNYKTGKIDMQNIAYIRSFNPLEFPSGESSGLALIESKIVKSFSGEISGILKSAGDKTSSFSTLSLIPPEQKSKKVVPEEQKTPKSPSPTKSEPFKPLILPSEKEKFCEGGACKPSWLVSWDDLETELQTRYAPKKIGSFAGAALAGMALDKIAAKEYSLYEGETVKSVVVHNGNQVFLSTQYQREEEKKAYFTMQPLTTFKTWRVDTYAGISEGVSLGVYWGEQEQEYSAKFKLEDGSILSAEYAPEKDNYGSYKLIVPLGDKVSSSLSFSTPSNFEEDNFGKVNVVIGGKW